MQNENIRILVLDDEERVRKIIGMQLEREGYHVKMVSGGDLAIEELQKGERFHLMISDIKMPGTDGMQVLQYVVENFPLMPVVMLTGVVDVETAISVMRAGAYDYLIKPITRKDLIPTVEKALAYSKLIRYNQRLEQENRAYQEELEEQVQERTRELTEALSQLHIIHMDTVRILSGAIEEKDPYIRGHSNRCRIMAHHVAKALGYSQRQLDMLDFGSLLHDVGKIAIDTKILNKPAPLSPDEMKLVQTHPLIGERIVSKVSYFSEIVPMIRWHHERWDGKGYPDGLKGEEIPVESRILNVVDSYDAMTSDRAYRLALSSDRALEIIREEAGYQFDSEIVELFLKEKTFELIHTY
ncbi:MAG TPA: response regulator [candidate division Zixibacteria bacterium]|nr:response regulator [candidate division Zixibacteria bacterium]